MDRRTKTHVATAMWIGPLLLGFAVATWFIVQTPPRGMDDGLVRGLDRDDWSRLQGRWEGIHVERNGRVVYQDRSAAQARVSFVGDSVVFEDRDARLEGTFRLDQGRTPKTFDLTVTERGTTTTYPAGIYQLSGDLFRLCFAFPSPERPTSFRTTPGSGRTLSIYRRARASGDGTEDGRPRGRPVVRPSIDIPELIVRRP
jgi:uncharacterized protein (TIGR03067 family)